MTTEKWAECRCDCPVEAHETRNLRNYFEGVPQRSPAPYSTVECKGILITPTVHYPCKCNFITKNKVSSIRCRSCDTMVDVVPKIWVGDLPDDFFEKEDYGIVCKFVETGSFDHEPVNLSEMIGGE